MGFDGKKFGEEIVAAVKAHVAKAVDPITSRLDALSKRVDEMPAAADGNAIASRVAEKVLAELPVAKDGVGLAGAFIDRDGELIVTLTDGRHQKLGPVVGKSADDRAIMQALCAEVSDRIESLKGEVDEARKNIPALELPDFAVMLADAVKALPLPMDGKSVTVDDVRPLIEAEVASLIKKMPKPKDGSDGADGADGRGIASMLIDRDGELIATMTDGRTEKLGPVVGRDGKDADMSAIEKMITDSVKALPKPKDGVDGLGFDDMDIESTDEGVFMRFAKGDDIKRYHVPMVVDCGVYKQGRTYLKGNGTTFGGSFWIAQKETTDKPGESDAWRLAVKRGRDGKDSK